MRGKVEICGINTAELKVLKNEEMVALLKRLRQGDESAREALICGNLRLVLSVIQRFSGRGEAMKLMNDIEAEYDGTVLEVLVQNGDAVEYGQALFVIG